MPTPRRLTSLLSIVCAALLLIATPLAGAQAYTSIVVIGDSLSDTGNDAALSAGLYTVAAQVPGPATGYTNGRFTDGSDTLPAAQAYFGVWIEQLAAKLAAKPAVKNSLAGGTNYAYGFAFTGTGMTPLTYGPGNVLSIPVNNMELQLSTYLATNPTITNKTLFVVWGGANDLLNATTATASTVVSQAVTNEATIVQGLINAGATDFLIVNLPPLGLIPRLNGSTTTSVPATQLAAAFNSGLATAIGSLPKANPGKTLNLFQLDVYTLFNAIVGPPLYKGLANATAMSQYATVNPDTYLFWDSLHPTTYGHSLIAAAALTAIGTPVATTISVASSSSSVNVGGSVTFTATVTGASSPTGTVAFFDDASVLGYALAYPTSTGTTSTATFTTTSILAGPQTISASFVGVNGYSSSTSASFTETVVAPAFTATASAPLTISDGQSGVETLNLSAVGGYAGTVTFGCGTLPSPHFTCSVSPTSITYPSSTTTAAVTIGTSGTARLDLPPLGPRFGGEIVAACIFLPCLGLIGRRRAAGVWTQRLLLLTVLGVLFAGISGCGGNGNSNLVPKGSYTVPVIVTASGTASTANIAVTVD